MLTLFHQIFTPANTGFMLKGLGMTIVIAVLAILISMFFGTILALIRTYASGRFKWAASLVAVYTELFTSAVMAEIVRGGLNSISKGQFEAAQSQGFSFIQTLWYIILPQTYRKIIPALLSQVITVIKDTSFLKMVDVAEFMRNCAVVMGSIYDVHGMIMLIGFEALCYFVICFALSCIVRSYQKTIVTA